VSVARGEATSSFYYKLKVRRICDPHGRLWRQNVCASRRILTTLCGCRRRGFEIVVSLSTRPVSFPRKFTKT